MDTPKKNARLASGAKSESHRNAKSTGDDYIPPSPTGKPFDSDAFLTACTGDIATLHLALVNLSTSHALTTPAMIHFAGRGVALAYLAAGGVL